MIDNGTVQTQPVNLVPASNVNTNPLPDHTVNDITEDNDKKAWTTICQEVCYEDEDEMDLEEMEQHCTMSWYDPNRAYYPKD